MHVALCVFTCSGAGSSTNRCNVLLLQVPSQFIRSRIVCLKWQKQVLEAKQAQLAAFLEANGVSYKLAAAEVQNPLHKLLSAERDTGMR